MAGNQSFREQAKSMDISGKLLSEFNPHDLITSTDAEFQTAICALLAMSHCGEEDSPYVPDWFDVGYIGKTLENWYSTMTNRVEILVRARDEVPQPESV